MSLDDEDVLAGLSDGAPFFGNTITHGSGNSHNPSWGDGPTPRANPCDAPPANGNKGARHAQQQPQSQGQTGNASATTRASLKELKDMWKQYMRTPLSGQPLGHEHHPAGSPKRERGLTRVASLPSVKTPSPATAGWGDPMRGASGNQQQQQQHQVPASNNAQQYAGHSAYTRGHNHTDDLRSYEQAVLAHRTPLTLHLAPRRRGNTTSTRPPNPTNVPSSEKGLSESPVGSGSGSDGSGSVFTDERDSTNASPAPGPPGLGGGTSGGGGGGGTLGVEDPTRPTFKRLPSQTLGPEYAKRVATTSLLSGARDEYGVGVGVGVGALGEADVPMLQQHQRGLAGQGHNHGHGHGLGLVMAERARRMSLPQTGGVRAGIVGLE